AKARASSRTPKHPVPFCECPRSTENFSSAYWRMGKGRVKLLALRRMSFLCAPVAQLDRALASGARGREFESPWARHSSVFTRWKIKSKGFPRLRKLGSPIARKSGEIRLQPKC